MIIRLVQKNKKKIFNFFTKNVAGIKKSRTFATALREKCIANKQIEK